MAPECPLTDSQPKLYFSSTINFTSTHQNQLIILLSEIYPIIFIYFPCRDHSLFIYSDDIDFFILVKLSSSCRYFLLLLPITSNFILIISSHCCDCILLIYLIFWYQYTSTCCNSLILIPVSFPHYDIILLVYSNFNIAFILLVKIVLSLSLLLVTTTFIIISTTTLPHRNNLLLIYYSCLYHFTSTHTDCSPSTD